MTNAKQNVADLRLFSDFARVVAVLLLFGSLLFAMPGFAQTCTPPSVEHPTLQQAIDDPNCATVSMQAQGYQESILITRSLELLGTGLTSSTVDGPITITGATTQVSLSEMGVRNGCDVPGVQIKLGAQVTTSNVSIAAAIIGCPALPSFLYSDGFEDI